MRTCIKCKNEKPLARFSWRNDTNAYRNECKDCTNISRRSQPRYRQWHKENKQKLQSYMRNYDLKRHYGVGVAEFEQMLNKQQGKCAICGTTNFVGKGKKPHADHCHNTGKIRGLLCNPCNVGLGSFRDNIFNLESAIEYLKNAGVTK